MGICALGPHLTVHHSDFGDAFSFLWDQKVILTLDGFAGRLVGRTLWPLFGR
jgi:hypothetical protein